MRSIVSINKSLKRHSHTLLSLHKRFLLLLFILPFLGNTCPQDSSITQPFDGGNLETESKASDKYKGTSLEVVQSSPQGMVSVNDLNREIVVVFNQPMVPLAKLKKTTLGVMNITPNLKGKFRWYGSRVNSFIPDEPMKPGTKYTVTVPKNTRSLSKQSLKENHRFSFKSPPLRYTYSSPYKNSPIAYDQKFQIHFNYPVTPLEIKKFMILRNNGRVIGFKMKQPEGSNAKEGKKNIILIPRTKFDRNAKVTLTLLRGLPPSGGNAGLIKTKTITYKTYGPLKAKLTNRANYFQDSYGIYIRFNNPVHIGKLRHSIKITPPLKSIHKSNETSRYFYFSSFALRPEITYNFELPKNLKDIYGNTITGNKKFSFTVPRVRKTFSMTSGINTVESLQKQIIPARAAAISKVSGKLYSFDVEQLQNFISKKSKDTYSHLRNSSSQYKNFTTGLNSQTIGAVGLDIKSALTNQKGWLLADITAQVENWRGKNVETSPSVVLQSTDIGLILKQSPGFSHAYVHSLTHGKSMQNILVSGYDGNQTLGTCRTNKIGYCRILHLKNKRPRYPIYVASTNIDKTFVTGRHHAVYMGAVGNVDFDLLSNEASLSGVIEFDRRLYKPGETMYFKSFLALVKKEKLTTRTPAKAQINIFNSRGKKILSVKKRVSSEGGINGHVKLLPNAATGHYRVEISFPSLQKRFASKRKNILGREYGYNSVQSHNRFQISETFQVEEFRPVQFSVSIDTKPSSLKKKVVHPFIINGKYLFGASMINAPVHFTVQKRKSNKGPKNYSNYRFGDFDHRDHESGWSYLSSGSGKLDSSGHYKNKISFKSVGMAAQKMGLTNKRMLATTQKFQIEARITDVDQKSVTHTTTITMQPATTLLGIQTKNLYNSTKTPFSFKLIAVTTKGKYAGKVPVNASIIFNEWKTIQTKGAGGSVQRKNTLIRRLVHNSVLKVSNKPTNFRYKAKKPGWYSIIVYGKSKDVYSRSSFYVYGGGFTGWDFSDDDSLELLADKANYKPGDMAKVLIQSPFKSARAIVSLERNGIMWQKSFLLKGNSYPVKIPITKKHSPVVYASVMLIRPRVRTKSSTNKNDDLGRPKFKMGYIALNVQSSKQKLPLKIITNQKTYTPGEEVQLTIKTRAHAEVALSVADRGVLDLISYSYKNPNKKFNKKLPLGVVIMENRQSLIRQLTYTNKGNSPGGKGTDDGAGMGGFDKDSEDGIRKNFKYTAHWSPSLKADRNGNISLRFRLPDNLTTFKIMALAARSATYASANKEIQVKQPLIIQPVNPSIIRPGDKLKVGAVLINQTGKDIKVKLNLRSKLLKVKGQNNNIINIKNGESVESLFTVSLNAKQYLLQKKAILTKLKKSKTLPVGGIHGVRVDSILTAVTMDANQVSRQTGLLVSDLKDKIAIKFDVYENPPAEAFSISGSVDKVDQTEAIQIPKRSEILDDLGNLDIEISNTALTGIKNGFRFFKDNPYFCLEQRTSAFIVGVSAGDLVHTFPQHKLQKGGYQFKELKAIFLDKLSDYQNSDGGFRLWKNTRYKVSNPYLTVWTIFGMQVAKENGYKINHTVKNKALRYLERFRRKPGRQGHDYMLSTYSLMAWVLARDGNVDKGLQRYLLKNEKKLGLREKSYLMLTLQMDRNIKSYKNDHDTKRLMQSLLDSMQFTTRSLSFKEKSRFAGGRSFQASGATLALALRAMIDLNPKHPMIPQAIRHIVDSRNRSLWSSSHSSANLAYSLKSYYNRFEKTPGQRVVEVMLGSKVILQKSMPAPKKSAFGFHKRLSLSDLYSSFKQGQQYDFQFKNKSKNKGRFYYTSTLNYLPKLLKAQARDEGIEVIREVIALSDLSSSNKTRNKVLDTLGSDTLKLGKMYLVRLTVTNSKPSFNFALIDPLPSTMEAVNSEFATESPAFSRFLKNKQVSRQPWWMREEFIYEYRKDKVVATTKYLSPGVHEFLYLARPIVKGTANAPAAQAFLMYSPEVFGRTASGKIRVTP